MAELYSEMSIVDLFDEVMLENELIHHRDVLPRIKELIAYTDSEGINILHEFCCKRYEEGIKVLLENGADPNQFDRYDDIPPFLWLLEVCRFDEKTLRITKMLIDHGADLYLLRKGSPIINSLNGENRSVVEEYISSQLEIKEPSVA
jgi:ankyrin repeat protein